MLTIGSLNEQPGIRHGFFTRNGGSSQGIYASLNCGFGADDDADKVASNRQSALTMLNPNASHLLSVYQYHSAEAVVVDTPWSPENAPRADAMVTNKPNLALGILTADCVPVLFADAEGGVIGAAHAGWRGALTGVLDATVEAMEKLEAQRGRITVGIGPAIEQRSYEVGPEFPGAFLEKDKENEAFFCPAQREGHFFFDIKGYVARRLAQLGLRDVHALPCDTYAEEERFFSYRRACHKNETDGSGKIDYGRGLSAICLAP
ncbi:peptidoglycan editing factor PgeF [Pelagibius sp. Alg239-R121]|uniref:peptidoglycan editing factor PgeF n=1 Tax=Pelagibius sp. Alg239-R121 TaxID=2993448 RepID=UPI0024A700E4|nr:peptidoglycan editing factor PgeF [Pelagibius sp. Alg239-R121]